MYMCALLVSVVNTAVYKPNCMARFILDHVNAPASCFCTFQTSDYPNVIHISRVTGASAIMVALFIIGETSV